MSSGAQMRFLCDSMLGRLAKYLRMLGFDTLYARALPSPALEAAALDQKRLILTRRSSFLKKKQAALFLFIQDNDPGGQLRQVISELHLTWAEIKPFTICLRCNRALESLPREAAATRVPDYVACTTDHFAACPDCGRVYWQGTHYRNMASIVDDLSLNGDDGTPPL